MMRRHFNIPEGIGSVALERDIRQSGRGGHFYNWDALPPNTMIMVPENPGKSVTYYYLKVHGDVTATNRNKIEALSRAVQELAAEKAPALEAKITSSMTASVVEVFHSNTNSAVLLSSFIANNSLRQQHVAEQERAKDLVMKMHDCGLADFLLEEEEKVRQKRARRQGLE